jgi:hypothetical protein
MTRGIEHHVELTPEIRQFFYDHLRYEDAAEVKLELVKSGWNTEDVKVLYDQYMSNPGPARSTQYAHNLIWPVASGILGISAVASWMFAFLGSKVSVTGAAVSGTENLSGSFISSSLLLILGVNVIFLIFVVMMVALLVRNRP